MPAQVDKLHDELIADPDFYPEKSEKEQEAIAWAIAYSQYNKKKKKKKSKKKASVYQIIRVAQFLDNSGDPRVADLLDEILEEDVSGNPNI